MKTIHKVKIDLLTPGLHPRVYAVQDDICTREVQISLYSGSVSWTPTSGAGVAVGYRKSDGTVGIYDTLPDGSSAVSISGNVVTVILAAQMLTAAGTVEAAVTLAEKSGNQITTFAFDVIVSANPGSGAIKSEDYFNYVNPKIQAVIEQAAAATTAANTAASRANASAELAEDAYDLADTANQKVDTLREVVSKLHSNIVETASGEVITVSDSAEAPLQGLKVFGKTTQNGTPTPDAPVALESVGDSGSVTTTVWGKNRMSGFTGTKENPYSITAVRDDHAIILKETSAYMEAGKPYTFSIYTDGIWGNENGSDTVEWLLMKDGAYECFYDSIGSVQNGERISKTIIPQATGLYSLRLDVNKNGATHSFWDAQVEEGKQATEYEPYNGGSVTVSTPNGLPGIPVTSGGNYTDANGQQWICDEVDFEKGVYVQRVGNIVIDDNYAQAVTINAAGTTILASLKNRALWEFTPCLCSACKTTDNPDEYANTEVCSRTGDSGAYIYFKGFGTLNEFNAYRASNPISVLYVLANPIEHALTAEERAQYAALRTNYPNTIIYNDAGAHMDLKYVADTKKYVDKKFAELAAALVSST